MGRKKDKTPAQLARAKYLEAHGLRGKSNSNIWFTKCPDTGKDLVLIGDARIEHFYACVGDPSVIRGVYGIEPHRVTVNGNVFTFKFDARIEFEDGRVEYRIVGREAPHPKKAGKELELEACRQAAKQLGGEYRNVSLQDLDRLKQRVNNWRRALRFLRACQNHPLGEAEAAILVWLQQRSSSTIGELLIALSDFEAPLLLGALVRLLHKRSLTSDLDKELFCRHTVIARARGAR